jgi:hypothetical protein
MPQNLGGIVTRLNGSDAVDESPPETNAHGSLDPPLPGIGSDSVAAGNMINATFDVLSQLAAKAEGSSGAKGRQGAGGA